MATTDTGTEKSIMLRIREWVTGESDDAPLVKSAMDETLRVRRKVYLRPGLNRLHLTGDPLGDLREVYQVTNLGPDYVYLRFTGSGDPDCILAPGDSVSMRYTLGSFWAWYRAFCTVVLVEGGK